MSKKPTWAVAAALDAAGVPCADEIAWMLRRHTCVPGEPVEENRVDPTTEAAGSYDSVTYCSFCGAELSRETLVLPKLKLKGYLYNGVLMPAPLKVTEARPYVLIYDRKPSETGLVESKYVWTATPVPHYSTDEEMFTYDYDISGSYHYLNIYIEGVDEIAWQSWVIGFSGVPKRNVIWTNYDVRHKDTGEVTFYATEPIPVYE